jgi:hypothetical protein
MHFCTYFDSQYLTRGLALYESLRRHGPPGTCLHALCLDEAAEAVLRRLGLPGLCPIARADFEAGDDDLAAARANRSTVEYYFTCTPSLPLYVLRSNTAIERVYYADADLYFFSAAAAVEEEMGDGSVYIVPHRFPPALTRLKIFGRFNVGILGFRNDAEGRRCLESWREQCNAWCYRRLEDDKFANQKYPDAWPGRFAGVVVARHPGVNLAPWNKARHRLSDRDGRPHVDGVPVVCYHFHGLRLYEGGLVEPQVIPYGNALDASWLRLIYGPYLEELQRLGSVLSPGRAKGPGFGNSCTLAGLPAPGSGVQLVFRQGGQWVEVPPAVLEKLQAGAPQPG